MIRFLLSLFHIRSITPRPHAMDRAYCLAVARATTPSMGARQSSEILAGLYGPFAGSACEDRVSFYQARTHEHAGANNRLA
jgi:hypothetical protein